MILMLQRFILSIALLATLALSSFAGATTAFAASHSHTSTSQGSLTTAQQSVLYAIARQTWRFFDADTDPNTHLPMDNLGLYGAPSGPYTSPTNIGVYFWTRGAAQRLGLVDHKGY